MLPYEHELHRTLMEWRGKFGKKNIDETLKGNICLFAFGPPTLSEGNE